VRAARVRSDGPPLTRPPAVSEARRQIALLEAGGAVAQETRGFDEDSAQTVRLRAKEDAPDYRYMPDPNLPPLVLPDVGPPFPARTGAVC
jgi:hypothetical protein